MPSGGCRCAGCWTSCRSPGGLRRGPRGRARDGGALGDAGSGYFETVPYSETLRAADAELTVHDTHRPLASYFDALHAAGFVVEVLAEPVPDDAHVSDHPEAARWRERPSFLIVKARKS